MNSLCYFVQELEKDEPRESKINRRETKLRIGVIGNEDKGKRENQGHGNLAVPNQQLKVLLELHRERERLTNGRKEREAIPIHTLDIK